MSTKLIFKNADFSSNALPKDTRWRLHSVDVVEGLIDNVDGGQLRPPSELFQTRVTTKEYVMLNEFDSVTIPAGMQVCAVFYQENGKYVGSGAIWIKNVTESEVTYDIETFSNNTGSNVVKCKLSFGWIDSSATNLHKIYPDDLNSTVKIYMSPVVQQIRIDSSRIVWGHITSSGEPSESSYGRVCMDKSQKLPLYKFPYVTVPEEVMVCVCYSRNGSYAGTGMGVWTKPTGKIAINSILAQDYAAVTSALGGEPTHFQLGFGRRNADGEPQIPFNGVEDFDNLYEVYVSRS